MCVSVPPPHIAKGCVASSIFPNKSICKIFPRAIVGMAATIESYKGLMRPMLEKSPKYEQKSMVKFAYDEITPENKDTFIEAMYELSLEKKEDGTNLMSEGFFKALLDFALRKMIRGKNADEQLEILKNRYAIAKAGGYKSAFIQNVTDIFFDKFDPVFEPRVMSEFRKFYNEENPLQHTATAPAHTPTNAGCRSTKSAAACIVSGGRRRRTARRRNSRKNTRRNRRS
jgi:hypothetical protein